MDLAQDNEHEELWLAYSDLKAELLAAQEREKALREAAQRFVADPANGDKQIALYNALAGSPSEKPGSEDEACPRCGATPDGGTSLDCPVCTGVTDAD